MKFEEIEHQVCLSCAHYIANNELPDSFEEHDKEQVKRSVHKLGNVAIDSGVENWFSWSPCDCCGCNLGGGRYLAIQLVEL